MRDVSNLSSAFDYQTFFREGKHLYFLISKKKIFVGSLHFSKTVIRKRICIQPLL